MLSIGMPVYNGEDFIEEAIKSIRNQSYTEFLLRIYDNNSQDNTYVICKKYEDIDPRIKVYQNTENIGSLENFRKSLYDAQTPFFMWAAHDDLWDSLYIEKLLEPLLRNPKLILSFSAIDSIDSNGNLIRKFNSLTKIPGKSVSETLLNFLRQYEGLGKANLWYSIIKTSVLRKSFDTVYPLLRSGVWGGDMLLVFQILTFGDISICPDILFHKRRSANPFQDNDQSDQMPYLMAYQCLINDSEVLTLSQKKHLLSHLLFRKKLYLLKSLLRKWLILD